MYEEVAEHPDADFHFETGRPLAERLGYAQEELDRIPAPAIDSFASVGHFLDLAALEPGEAVLDLGSGSGMDSFLAALAVGPDGTVVGVDMTAQQLAKARRLATDTGIADVEFREGYIEGGTFVGLLHDRAEHEGARGGDRTTLDALMAGELAREPEQRGCASGNGPGRYYRDER
jgi:SAM-dependent methyltransferase